MAKKARIRPIALCVFRYDDQILVGEGYDEVKRETFYRPIGGGIEFGEYAQGAVMREVMEEIKQALTDVQYLGTLENIFVFNGKPGHEIILIYEAVFADKTVYERETIAREDDHHNLRLTRWLPLAFFERGEAPLYPEGLLELLTSLH